MIDALEREREILALSKSSFDPLAVSRKLSVIRRTGGDVEAQMTIDIFHLVHRHTHRFLVRTVERRTESAIVLLGDVKDQSQFRPVWSL